jgi:hypothetical protein
MTTSVSGVDAELMRVSFKSSIGHRPRRRRPYSSGGVT